MSGPLYRWELRNVFASSNPAVGFPPRPTSERTRSGEAARYFRASVSFRASATRAPDKRSESAILELLVGLSSIHRISRPLGSLAGAEPIELVLEMVASASSSI